MPDPSSPSGSTASIPPAFSVLVYSKTEGFRHDSIPAGIAAIRQLGQQRGFSVDATEDGEAFADAALAKYKVVVFLSTTGDVLNETEQRAFERYIRGGGGFVGIHSATDTEYGWPFYGGLVGAYFAGHPDIQTATVQIENTANPSTASLPRLWIRRDEWYNFQKNPRGTVDVLATVDERSYAGGTMAGDHPIMWSHTYEGGRAWYTAGGHTTESYSEPLFVGHLGTGILWAAGAI
jgi:cytochrome c